MTTLKSMLEHKRSVGYTMNECYISMHNCTISRNHSKYTIIWTKIVQTKVVKYCTIGPDCLESTILKITGKISVVIYSLLVILTNK